MKLHAAKLKIVAFMVVMFTAASVCETALTPVGVAKGYMVRSEGNQPSSEAVSHAFGEFRIVAANLIWLNVIDKYHHEYMKQGGTWSKNAALLPYLRIITMLDPHFIEAYDVASSILANISRYDESEAFLTNAIKHNPDNWQMYFDMAILHAWYRNDARSALPFAKQADARATDPFIKHRMSLLVKTLSDDIKSGTKPVLK